VCCRFGEGLQRSEQEWLVSEINGHLEAIRGVAPTAEDMGSVDLPKVRIPARLSCCSHAGVHDAVAACL
jgi:hypothetical protein